MYADRHARPEGIKPGSLTIAIGINAALIGALMFVSPVFEVVEKDGPLQIISIPADPPPKPIQPPETKPEANKPSPSRQDPIIAVDPIVSTTSDGFVLPQPPLPPLPPLPPGEAVRVDPPVAPPVLIEARIDPRYIRDLQPAYPPGERRAEREGKASVRVTIGIDGRVTAVECVSATSDDFCRATRQQALAKWRFRPATRDGAPVEASQVMTVRFVLES
ncbi:energy transducer TonB [Sphingomonas radiodurans]|uniref:energy transducer TonB n=1 Tax=Sphingomonas radiodurans TaxID=2890321 RepID=UPI001E2BEA8E|nr:energy transducer TonB [Sphingomonas radiodurans]WBH15464.1 energy transducer TonB [Sphingomonas radiodurans]